MLFPLSNNYASALCGIYQPYQFPQPYQSLQSYQSY